MTLIEYWNYVGEIHDRIDDLNIEDDLYEEFGGATVLKAYANLLPEPPGHDIICSNATFAVRKCVERVAASTEGQGCGKDVLMAWQSCVKKVLINLERIIGRCELKLQEN